MAIIPTTDESVVFPIGHYMGPFHPRLGEPAAYHVVRIGVDIARLPDQAHVDIWALAHGLPGRIHWLPWTREAIVQAASDAGMPDAAAILDNLARLGVIAEVVPHGEQAQEFAKLYRCEPLLIGLGNSPEDPWLDGIGLAGLAPIVKVRPRVREVWQWAHQWPNLWGLCEGLAWWNKDGGSDKPGEIDPAAVLDLVLEALRSLISGNAVYLDLAATPGVTRAER